MDDYSLYFFRRFQVVARVDLSADDDDGAIDQALKLLDGRTADLWRGSTKIKTWAAASDGEEE